MRSWLYPKGGEVMDHVIFMYFIFHSLLCNSKKNSFEMFLLFDKLEKWVTRYYSNIKHNN